MTSWLRNDGKRNEELKRGNGEKGRKDLETGRLREWNLRDYSIEDYENKKIEYKKLTDRLPVFFDHSEILT